MSHQDLSAKPEPFTVDSAAIEVAPIQIPGATPGGIAAQLLNIDLARGIVATIIHFRPGAEIPAHFHKEGAEAHFVLEGELTDGDRTYGPGAYLTHAAGVVHGPHRSEKGCRVLTVQGGKMAAGDSDFHLADENGASPAGGDQRAGESRGGQASVEANARPAAAESGSGTPPDMEHEPVAATELLESQKTAPTADNPTNPTTS